MTEESDNVAMDASTFSAVERGDGAINELLTGEKEEVLPAEDNAALDSLLGTMGVEPGADATPGDQRGRPAAAEPADDDNPLGDDPIRQLEEPAERKEGAGAAASAEIPPELLDEAATYGIGPEVAKQLGSQALSQMMMGIESRFAARMPAAPPELVRPAPVESAPVNGTAYKPQFDPETATPAEMRDEFARLDKHQSARSAALEQRLERYEQTEMRRAVDEARTAFNAGIAEVDPDGKLFGGKSLDDLPEYGSEALRQGQVMSYVQHLVRSPARNGRAPDIQALTKVAARGLFAEHFQREAVGRTESQLKENAKSRLRRPARRNVKKGMDPRNETVAAVQEILDAHA